MDDGAARAVLEDELEARVEARVAERVAERMAALAQSEEYHRHIIESLPGGVLHIASDGTFARANAEAVRFLGRSLEELVNRKLPDYAGEALNEDGSNCAVADFSASKCLATGRPQGPCTIGIRRPDGTVAWGVFTAVPIACPRYPGRQGVVVTFLNITERKLAEETLRHAREDLERSVAERTAELARSNELLREEIAERIRSDTALRDSEARFRQITENIAESVWISDVVTGKLLYVSPAYENIWGRSVESICEDPQRFFDSVVPEDQQRVHNEMLNYQVRPVDAVYRIHDAAGGVRWIRSRSAPVRNAAGEIYRVTGIAEDITDLKRAEEELSRLASIVESSDDAIIGKSLEGKVTSWNSGAERIYGWRADEVVGRSALVLMPSEEHAGVAPLLARVGRGERIESFETRRLRKDGTEFVVSMTLSSVRDSAGHVIGASAIERDITEHKWLEEEVLQISERERLRIGQDLHDGLGQHLTGIAFLGKSLQQRLALKAAAHAPASNAEVAELGQISELVQEAIGQTRAIARGLHPVEQTAEGLMSALAELAAEIGTMFKLECLFDCDLPVLVPDNLTATHLYRIAQEAVNNAVKYARAKRIDINITCADGRLTLRVQDNGVGIGELEECRAGLGLNIMRYRATMIGAALTIGRRPQGGTLVECVVESGCPAEGAGCSEKAG